VDGEMVWSRRALAGVKFVLMRFTHRADDGGKSWFTGESAYKP
jgi:hypothetical protein